MSATSTGAIAANRDFSLQKTFSFALKDFLWNIFGQRPALRPIGWTQTIQPAKILGGCPWSPTKAAAAGIDHRYPPHRHIAGRRTCPTIIPKPCRPSLEQTGISSAGFREAFCADRLVRSASARRKPGLDDWCRREGE
jgi:hypothetical protein